MLRTLLLTAVLSLTASPSFGDPGLATWVGETVKFKACSSDQIDLIRGSLTEGLAELRSLNPDFLANRLQTVTGHSVTFDCDATTALEKGAAGQAAVKTRLGFLGIPVSKLKLAADPQLVVGKLLAGESNSGFALQAALLHEFLHFLSFDNLNVKIHNDSSVRAWSLAGGLNGRSRNYTSDVVYSCSIAAFPSLRESGAEKISVTELEKAAQTCAAAKVYSGKVDVDLSALTFLEFRGTGRPTSVNCVTRKIGTPDLSLVPAKVLSSCPLRVN